VFSTSDLQTSGLLYEEGAILALSAFSDLEGLAVKLPHWSSPNVGIVPEVVSVWVVVFPRLLQLKAKVNMYVEITSTVLIIPFVSENDGLYALRFQAKE